jgi:hypothetical protein
MCSKKAKKPSFVERVERHTGGFTSVSSGLCGCCSECQRYLNMKVEVDDVEIRPDGMYLLGECILSRETLMAEIKEDAVCNEDYLFELRYIDIPEELQTKLFNEKISDQRYLDEGSFSWQGCDTCGNPLGNTLHCGHGLDKDLNITHVNMCTDCVMFFANGDLPEEDGPEESDCMCGDTDYETLVKESGLIVVTKERETGWVSYHKKGEPDNETSMPSACCDWYELAEELGIAEFA